MFSAVDHVADVSKHGRAVLLRDQMAICSARRIWSLLGRRSAPFRHTPFGKSRFACERSVRTSSRLIPVDASAAGLTCTRTADFAATDDHLAHAIDLAQALSENLIRDIRKPPAACVSEVMASTMIGASAGLTFRYDGGEGRQRQFARRRVDRACTSRAAPSTLRFRSNWIETTTLPAYSPT